jgi:hypothetical protein
MRSSFFDRDRHPLTIPGQDERLFVRVGFEVSETVCVAEECGAPHIRQMR